MAKVPEDRTPAPAGQGGTPAAPASRAEIDAFLAKVRSFERTAPSGRAAG